MIRSQGQGRLAGAVVASFAIIIIIIILINAPMQVHGEGKGERWKMKWHYIHDKLFTTESASGSEGFVRTNLMRFE